MTTTTTTTTPANAPVVVGGGGPIIFDDLPTELTEAVNTGNTNTDGNVADADDDVDSNGNNSAGNFSAADYSVDTTHIASSVGSVVRSSREAFLRSVTFMKDQPHDLVWDLTFEDPTKPLKVGNGLTGKIRRSMRSTGVGGSKTRKVENCVKISSIGGHLTLSKLQVGEVVTKINKKKIGPSYNAQRCTDLLNKSLDTDGVVSIQTGNDDGNDTIVQVTVIKPEAKMTCEEMGLTVWFWRGLCIKGIEPGSIFSYTALKMDDELERVNDIDVQRLKPEAFHKIIDELPYEVTIEVKRGKQRWTGKFG